MSEGTKKVLSKAAAKGASLISAEIGILIRWTLVLQGEVNYWLWLF